MLIDILPLKEADLPAADRVFREAFGTFLGLPDPQTFTGDADILATRWRADPSGVLGAYADSGVLVGSCLVARWGSFGFLGPITIRSDLWNQGVARRLLDKAVALLDEAPIRQSALFTFPQSAKHIALYQKYGFWPQYLTPVMAKAPQQVAVSFARYSEFAPDQRAACLAQCAALTERIFPGLDVSGEIRSVENQRLGETVLFHDEAGLAGFAVCHIGAGSEAGSGATFVKFGAARPGPGASAVFERLLDACESLAAGRGCGTIVAGINTAHHQAYRQMIDRGYRTFLEGVAMLRPNEVAFNRPDCFVIDDLR